MRIPYFIYADFDSYAENIYTSQFDLSRSYTKQYQHHTFSGFCYHNKSVHWDDKVSVLYQGPSGAMEFENSFICEIEDIREKWNSCR